MGEMKLLVGITNWGTVHDHYLARVVAEYRSMSFDVDIVVLTNAEKQVAPGVEVVAVDLKGQNPLSLPFAHKKLFSERLRNYDLFIYSEDDILITERNIRTFLEDCEAVAEDELPGLLLYETDPGGNRYLCNIHDHFRWNPALTRRRANRTFGFFTNEHAACYILTRKQLERAIASGGYLVPPYEGRRYDLPCTASTDPYTQCGFLKVIDLSRIEDYLAHHLPNKYVGRMGISYAEFAKHVETLTALAGNGCAKQPLFEFETKIFLGQWSKALYESVRPELMSLIPRGTRSLLSIGSGSGALEEGIQRQGIQVTALPIDEVLGAVAEERGIRIVHGGFQAALAQLRAERFDCLLFSNVLHLLPNPTEILSSFATLLSDSGHVVAGVPNLPKISVFLRGLAGGKAYRELLGDEEPGFHVTSPGIMRKWFRSSGLSLDRVVFSSFGRRVEPINRATFGLLRSILSSQLWVRARTL